jgi:hypothetical protein
MNINDIIKIEPQNINILIDNNIEFINNIRQFLILPTKIKKEIFKISINITIDENKKKKLQNLEIFFNENDSYYTKRTCNSSIFNNDKEYSIKNLYYEKEIKNYIKKYKQCTNLTLKEFNVNNYFEKNLEYFLNLSEFNNKYEQVFQENLILFKSQYDYFNEQNINKFIINEIFILLSSIENISSSTFDIIFDVMKLQFDLNIIKTDLPLLYMNFNTHIISTSPIFKKNSYKNIDELFLTEKLEEDYYLIKEKQIEKNNINELMNKIFFNLNKFFLNKFISYKNKAFLKYMKRNYGYIFNDTYEKKLLKLFKGKVSKLNNIVNFVNNNNFDYEVFFILNKKNILSTIEDQNRKYLNNLKNNYLKIHDYHNFFNELEISFPQIFTNIFKNIELHNEIKIKQSNLLNIKNFKEYNDLLTIIKSSNKNKGIQNLDNFQKLYTPIDVYFQNYFKNVLYKINLYFIDVVKDKNNKIYYYFIQNKLSKIEKMFLNDRKNIINSFKSFDLQEDFLKLMIQYNDTLIDKLDLSINEIKKLITIFNNESKFKDELGNIIKINLFNIIDESNELLIEYELKTMEYFISMLRNENLFLDFIKEINNNEINFDFEEYFKEFKDFKLSKFELNINLLFNLINVNKEYNIETNELNHKIILYLKEKNIEILTKDNILNLKYINDYLFNYLFYEEIKLFQNQKLSSQNSRLLYFYKLISVKNNNKFNFINLFKNNIKTLKDFFNYEEIISNFLIKNKEMYITTLNKLKDKATIENIENYFKPSYKRDFICHFGPTNSGKTYDALQEFKKAKSAIYLAPLRLLAREIYDEFKDELDISLVTGEEIIGNVNASHITSTIEMLDIEQEFEVAIIDEIQMIDDIQRGNSWTRALMGVKAKKVFVIGSQNTESFVKIIIEKCNDNIDIKYFERLTKLEKFEEPIIEFSDIQKGDAIVAFSRNEVHNLSNKLINDGFKVSLIYGALPPKTRIEQANLFNKGKTDILITTDAIGMGLNLNIKRIVFTSMMKYDGYDNYDIPFILFQQIAGRAGRFGKYDIGYYCFLNSEYFNRYFELEEHEYTFNKYSSRLKNIDRKITTGYFFPELKHLITFAKNLNENLQDFSKFIKNIDGTYNFEENLSQTISIYKEYFYDSSNNFIFTNIEQYIEVSSVLDDFEESFDDLWCGEELLDKYNFNINDIKSLLTFPFKYKLSFAPIPYLQDDEVIFYFIKYVTLFSIQKKIIENESLNKEIEIIEELYDIILKFEKMIDETWLEELEKNSKIINLFLWIFYRFFPNNILFEKEKNKLISINEKLGLKIHNILKKNKG